MAKAKTKIPVTCTGSRSVDPASLVPFQQNLKTLMKPDFERLKRALEQYGFTAPVFVWEGKILDGHQRLHVLLKMLNDGYTLEGGQVPVVDVQAASEKEAREKLLLFASQYGQISDETLYEFLNTNDLSFDLLEPMINLPHVDPLLFRQGYGKDDAPRAPMSEFQRPTFKDDGKAPPTPDEKYFYIEYYEKDAEFKELVELLGEHMRTSHEIEPAFFADLLRTHLKGTP